MIGNNDQIFYRLAVAACIQKCDLANGLSSFFDRTLPLFARELDCRRAIFFKIENGMRTILWPAMSSEEQLFDSLGIARENLIIIQPSADQGFHMEANGEFCFFFPVAPGEYLLLTRGRAFENSQMEALSNIMNIFANSCSSISEVQSVKENERREMDHQKQYFQEKLAHMRRLQNLITHMATDFINIPVDQSKAAVNNLLALVGRENEVNRVYIFSYDFDKRVMSNTYEWCSDDVSPEMRNLQDLPMNLFQSWVQTHVAGKMLIVPDVSKLDKEDILRLVLEPQGIQTLVTVPMIFNNECLGFVGFDSVKKIKLWSEEEISFLHLLADLICNVTDRRIKENALKKATEAAQAANVAKTRFLANMSHEIRTPLNAIIGMVRLLLDSKVDPSQFKLINNMKASSENLLGIVNDILDFSKIESGQIEISKSDFSIHELIRKVYDGNEFRAEDKGIKFIYNIDPQISKYQKGDPLRLLQVLNNLVSNAIKFTAEGKVEVKLGLLGTDETGERIRFAVNDTGKGISPENQEKIFNSFQQEDESITRNYGGTGLGLAISKQLVELMGGKLELESTKDVGSQFFFVLTFEIGKNPVNESVAEAKPTRGQSLNGVRILLVEDNKFNQFVAQAILEKWGATVEICDDGEPAIERLRIESFDLILMDIQMPEMDGITATNIIRKELGLKTPILALTANVMGEIFELCNQAGMQGYVSKPIDEQDFYEKIVSAISLPDETVQLADLARLSKLFNHDKKMIGKAIRKFIEVTPSYVNDLKLSAEKHDVVAIEIQSHKIKGTIDAISTEIMHRQIFRINEIAKIGRFTPEKYVEQKELYEIIDNFLRTFPELLKQIENELPGYS